MKQNWWKLVVVVVLVVAVAGVVATKNSGTDKAQTPTVENSVDVASDDKSATDTVKTESPDEGKPDTSEKAADSIKADMQNVAAAVDKLEDESKAKEAAAKSNVQKPEVSPLENEDTKPEATPAKTTAKGKHLPKLVDLGATKCIPCKMMAPILEELSKEHKGKLEVVFIDVWENEKASEKYHFKTIPTQILFDENGKEFFRHEGFFPKDQILAKFKEHGITFSE